MPNDRAIAQPFWFRDPLGLELGAPVRAGHGSRIDVSKSGGAAVLAAIRSRDQRAGWLVAPDDLAAAERNHRADDFVTATRQLVLDVGWNRLLEIKHAVMAKTAWRVERLLHVEAAIEDP